MNCMVTTVKVALSVVGLLLSVIVYTVVFSVVTLRIHGAMALGWPSLRNDPLFWLLLILVVGGVGWVCWRWVSK